MPSIPGHIAKTIGKNLLEGMKMDTSAQRLSPDLRAIKDLQTAKKIASEGLHPHAGPKSPMKEALQDTTVWGSRLDKLKMFAKFLGRSYDEIIGTDELTKVLSKGSVVKEFTPGAQTSRVSLMEAEIGGKPFQYVMKQFKEGTKREAIIREANVMNRVRGSQYTPTAYGVQGNTLFMEAMEGVPLEDIKDITVLNQLKDKVRRVSMATEKMTGHFDIHGGNILYNEAKNQLSVLDFGFTRNTPRSKAAMKAHFTEWWSEMTQPLKPRRVRPPIPPSTPKRKSPFIKVLEFLGVRKGNTSVPMESSWDSPWSGIATNIRQVASFMRGAASQAIKKTPKPVREYLNELAMYNVAKGVVVGAIMAGFPEAAPYVAKGLVAAAALKSSQEVIKYGPKMVRKITGATDFSNVIRDELAGAARTRIMSQVRPRGMSKKTWKWMKHKQLEEFMKHKANKSGTIKVPFSQWEGMSRDVYVAELMARGVQPADLINIKGVEVGASTVVKPENEIYKKWTGQRKSGLSRYTTQIMEVGTAIHEYEQARLASTGQLAAGEMKTRLGDTGIRSFIDVVRSTGEIEEIKSIGEKRLAMRDRPYPMHVAQLMLYLAAENQQRGYVSYIAREDMSVRKRFQVEYDQSIVDEQLSKLARVRARTIAALDSGEVTIDQLRKSAEYGEIDTDRLGHEFEFYNVLPYRDPSTYDLAAATDTVYREMEELRKIKRPVPGNLDEILAARMQERSMQSETTGASGHHGRMANSVAAAKVLSESKTSYSKARPYPITPPSGNHGVDAHEERLYNSMDAAAKQSHTRSSPGTSQVAYLEDWARKEGERRSRSTPQKRRDRDKAIVDVMLAKANEGGHVFIDNTAKGYRRM